MNNNVTYIYLVLVSIKNNIDSQQYAFTILNEIAGVPLFSITYIVAINSTFIS